MPTDLHDLTALRQAAEAGFHLTPEGTLHLLRQLDTARAVAVLLEAELQATAEWLCSVGYPWDLSFTDANGDPSYPPEGVRQAIGQAWLRTDGKDEQDPEGYLLSMAEEGGWPEADDPPRPRLQLVAPE